MLTFDASGAIHPHKSSSHAGVCGSVPDVAGLSAGRPSFLYDALYAALGRREGSVRLVKRTRQVKRLESGDPREQGDARVGLAGVLAGWEKLPITWESSDPMIDPRSSEPGSTLQDERKKPGRREAPEEPNRSRRSRRRPLGTLGGKRTHWRAR